MNYRLIVTGPAKRDILANVEWWSENRSAKEADRWFLGIDKAIDSLQAMPMRHGFADEKVLMESGVRQMGFGLSSRPTHRIVYAVENDTVVILRVRSAAQSELSMNDLS